MAMANIIGYDLMQLVHDQSLPTIELLQQSFPNNKDFMINISTLFDPRYVFLIYIPLLFAFNKLVGFRMVIALTLAEWLNQILKWLLAGERPYWYVHERANELAIAFNKSQELAIGQQQLAGPSLAQLPQPPLLQQFPVTCELGAGSPSGHAMVTATVWYILIDAYHKGELKLFERTTGTSSNVTPTASNQKQTTLATLCWSAYGIMLALVSLSRVYLACHFPHQCVSGALLGAVLAWLVAERMPMHKLTRSHFCLATCAMFAGVMATYALLRSSGFDPLWSVDKAMRWCVKKEYIHLDTTPFFSMMRYLGVCLGAGLAYEQTRAAKDTIDSIKLRKLNSGNNNAGHLFARRLLAGGLAIAFGQLLLAIPAPKANLNLFYVISLVIYTLFAYAAAGPIQTISRRLVPATNWRQVVKST